MIRESLLRLTRQSVVYGIGQVVGRGLQVLLVPVLTRLFSPAEYGVLDMIALVASVASFFVIMGMDSAIARFFYEAPDEDARRVMVASSAAWRLLVGAAIALVFFFAAPVISSFILGDAVYAKYIRILAVALPFSTFVMFHNDVLRVTFQPSKFVVLNIANTLLVFGLTVWFVVALDKQISGALWARVLADVLTTVLGFVLIRRSLVRRIDRAVLGRMVRFGLPIIPAALAYWVISFADRWILLQAADLAAVGVYAIAVKLGFVVTLFVSAFQLAWGPFAYERAGDPGAGRLYARVLTLFVGGGSSLALVVGLFAPEILHIIVPGAYQDSAAPGALLAFAAVATGAYQIASLGLSLDMRTDLLGWTALVAAIVTVALALMFVRPLGLLGVAIATLAGYTVSTIMAYILAQRLLPLPFRGARAFALFLVAIATWVAGFAVHSGTAAGPGGTASLVSRIGLVLGFLVIVAVVARRPADRAAGRA